MSQPSRSELRHVRDLKPMKTGQISAVYEYDGGHIWVSTVDLSAPNYGPAERAILDMGGMLGAATGGEETMAFRSDAEGNVLDWTEIDCSTGAGSRADLLERLAEMESAHVR